MGVWSVAAAWVYICLGLLVVLITALTLFFFRLLVTFTVQGELCKVFSGRKVAPPTSENEECLKTFVRADALFVTMAPLISLTLGLAIAPWALPSWVPMSCAAPFVARALYVDFKLSASPYRPLEDVEAGTSTGGGWKIWCAWVIMDFLLSKLEILDAISDGVVVAKSFLLDDDAKLRFTASLQQLPAWIGGPMSSLALRGLLTLTLLAGVVVQLFFVLNPQVPAAAHASQAGLGGFAASRQDDEEKGKMKGARFIGRVLCEGLPQLLLQTSVAMAQGRALLEDRVLALSLLLSVLTVGQKAAEMPFAAMKLVQAGGLPKDRSWRIYIVIVLFLPIPVVLTLVAFAFTRLYFAATCPSHSWGLSTGCVG